MKPHEEWIFKAEHDLESATVLYDSGKPLLDMAIFHTQQSAEKAFKGFLAWNNIEVEKTHHLPRLNQQCLEIDSSFSELVDAAL